MQDFVHLHVHTQYSILDGQASIPRLVDKAMADGMKGIAVTDHGDMFGIKEFFNYVNKKNSSTNGEIKDLKKRIAGLEKGTVECDNPEAELVACKEKLEAAKRKLFKPIFGCEMYVARRRLFNKEGKPDQSGYHLVVLAKNEKGYHNLIKLVSKAWTEGFYMRPRTDRVELEKYHGGLIVCTACIAGEVPRNIIAGKYEEAEEAIQWYKRVFGDDFKSEFQGDLAEKLMLKGIERNDVDNIIKTPANYEELCKLAIAYSDGVIQNSEKVNENVMKFARESGIPVLDYQSPETYADAFNNFYDEVWEFEKK